MGKVMDTITGLLIKLSYHFASQAVNTACFWRYYQEEFDDQINSLKKY